MTPKGNVIRDTKYYLDMLAELVDALDDAISQKVKMTQYVDKLMKKKFKTYVRLKSDDKKEWYFLCSHHHLINKKSAFLLT